MANGDIITYIKGTLPASTPGNYASVELTASGIAATDVIVISIAGSTAPKTSTGDSFGIYGEIGTDIVTVYANRPQTPAVGVDLVVIEKR
jgi:hypothetical protein